jgi:hypothetical protein
MIPTSKVSLRFGNFAVNGHYLSVNVLKEGVPFFFFFFFLRTEGLFLGWLFRVCCSTLVWPLLLPRPSVSSGSNAATRTFCHPCMRGSNQRYSSNTMDYGHEHENVSIAGSWRDFGVSGKIVCIVQKLTFLTFL